MYLAALLLLSFVVSLADSISIPTLHQESGLVRFILYSQGAVCLLIL